MKRTNRLQFRHRNEVFANRVEAIQYFDRIANTNEKVSDSFGESLYAEPLVAKYFDDENNQQVIFAIGVDSGYTKYHIIDSKEIAELIDSNKKAIEAEVERAIDAEKSLSGSIETEIARAMEAELFLSGAVDTEREERIAADAFLQTQITENIAKIVPVTENLGANVREEYVLKNAKGEELGSHIKIYKDSALVGAEVHYKGATAVSQKEDGTFEYTYGADMDKDVEYLYLIYRNENGGLSLVALDFENFLMENEEGFGIKIVDHKITIKIKDGEKYLTTTEDGLQTVAIDEAIKEAVDALSDNLTAKIEAEIERSTAADDYISGLTAEFSAATVAEFVLVNSAVTVETERAMAAELYLSGAVETETARALEAELFLSGAVDTERVERIAENDAIKAEITSNKIVSKDLFVDKQSTGTSLTIQTDEITITKYADAQAIYDSEVSILGSLLKIKKVETNDTSIKSRYELQGADNKCIGDPIVLPVESALVDVKQGRVGDEIDVNTGNYITEGSGDTTMNFVYRLEDGSYELMQVVVAEYFTDAHFGRGLNNQDGVVSLKEGDGNEYLVIGEDTISVVGVKSDIEQATNRANSYTNDKYNEATGYTDSQISLVTDTTNTAIGAMNDTVNSAVQSMNSTLETAVQSMNSTLNSAVQSLNSTLNDSIALVNTALSTEISNRETADSELRFQISEESSARLSAITEVNSAITIINGAIDDINRKKVNDVIYKNGEKKIYLTFADGSTSEGFDASEFVVDRMLDVVSFDENTNEIKFVWNTSAGKSDVIVPLNKFVDQYKVSNDSISFVKISDDNQISAIVDEGDGYVKTLATTDYVKTKANETYSKAIVNIEALSANTSSALTIEHEYVNTVSGNIETYINSELLKTNETIVSISGNLLNVSGSVIDVSGSVINIKASVNELSGTVGNVISAYTNGFTNLKSEVNETIISFTDNIKNYIKTADTLLQTGVTDNKNAINILNGSKHIEGSVLNKIETELDKAVIYHGTSINTITPEDAKNLHSLIYQVIVNGEKRYYASSDADNMYYIKPETREAVNLNEYITSLETRVAVLEKKFADFTDNMEQTMKDIIKSYLNGTENEIKITETDDKLTIGFDDNAIFGEI